jgi:hypothetical protein
MSSASFRLILLTIILTVTSCVCQVDPPPLHFEAPFAADEQDCQGDIDHGHWDLQWHWDRCALPGSTIWTALYFAHRRHSESEVRNSICSHDVLPHSDMLNCRNSFDARRLFELSRNRMQTLTSREFQSNQRHICSSPECQPQYTPFIAEHPCLLSTHPELPLTDGSLNPLPPLTLSLFIQNENEENASGWSLWQPSLNFSFSVLNCAEDAAPYHEWNLFTGSFSDSFRCCNCPVNVFPTDLLRLHANTLYLHDNIFLDTFTLQHFSQLNSVTCHPFRVSISARLMPSDSQGRADFRNDDVALHPMLWKHDFHASTRRVVPKHASSKLIRRRSAKAISHKLCETVASYHHCKSDCLQTYDANTHTVSTSFSLENDRLVSVVALAASVKHTENGIATFEALVWTEFDQKCGSDDTLIHHCVGQKLELAVMCDVAGNASPGIITQDVVSNTYREAVISCEFNSDLFKRSFGEVLVSLSDSMRGFKLMLPMCSLGKEPPMRKLVACSQPIHSAKFIEKRWPGVLQAWVLHNVRFTVSPKYVPSSCLAYFGILHRICKLTRS